MTLTAHMLLLTTKITIYVVRSHVTLHTCYIQNDLCGQVVLDLMLW